MMRGAFARSPVTRALRNDIAPAMEKWWKAHKKDDGLVSIVHLLMEVPIMHFG